MFLSNIKTEMQKINVVNVIRQIILRDALVER